MIVLAALYTIGGVTPWVVDYLLVVVLGAILQALALPLLAVHWLGIALNSEDFKNILIGVASGFGSSAIAQYVLVCVPALFAGMLYGILCLIGSFGLVVLSCRGTSGGFAASSETEVPSSGESDGKRGRFSFKGSLLTFQAFERFAVMALAPLAGLCFYAIISSVRHAPAFGEGPSEPFAGLIAAIVLLLVGRRQNDKRLIVFIYWVVIPVSAVIAIVMDSFPLYTAPRLIGVLCNFIFGAMMTVVGLVVVCAIAQSREFPRTLVACVTVAALSLSSLIGLVVTNAGVLEDLVGPVANIICVAYYGMMVLWPCLDLWRMSESNALDLGSRETSLGRGAVEALKERCDALADEYGLTRREREVFSYLGRGYSPAYIARVLFVSESTVRSHVKSIYQKLRVDSREDLISLVDSN